MIGLCLNLVACSDDNDNIDPNAAAPVVKFPMEQLDIDLNLVDNLPVVAVIKSQAGLQQVDMKIQTAEGIIDYKTVTEFLIRILIVCLNRLNTVLIISLS